MELLRRFLYLLYEVVGPIANQSSSKEFQSDVVKSEYDLLSLGSLDGMYCKEDFL
jgi:hypothetical protein